MTKPIQKFPKRISVDIFKSYYYLSLKQKKTSKNTGVVIDDGLFEFIFLKEKNVQVESNGQVIPLPQIFIIGKVAIPSRLIIPKTMTYFTIKIQPWVAYFFLDRNYTSVNDLSKSIYTGIDQLHQLIFTSKNIEEQIKHVEDYFLKRDLPNLHNSETSKEICNYIHKKHGDIKVKNLLTLFPSSRQKLNQIFFEQTKNSIKEFAVLTRLRSIMSYHMKYPEKSLTSIAYDFGYADQSHFIKDMKKVTGVTPSKFSNTKNIFFEQLKTHS